MVVKQIDGKMLQKMIVAAANHLENNKKIVDELNVFPVPDGDTGTNMSLTLLAASAEVKKMKEVSAASVANSLASASLRGARGNSGVILSQLFRGFSKELKKYDVIDAKIFAQALKSGADTAYKAVMKPTEGTILTVAREGAQKAYTVSKKSENIVEILETALAHAKVVLDKTPEMLPVLKQAGVVDAGGKGLIFILEGALCALKGEEVLLQERDEEETGQTPEKRTDIPQDITFTYCTEFLIRKENSTMNRPDIAEQFKRRIDIQGDSMLVIDDEEIIKVHIHTNNPGTVIQEALKIGELLNIKIDNMKEQHDHIMENGIEKHQNNTHVQEEKEYGFISVAIGDGIVSVLKDLGVDKIIQGGQTMNPSTDDILKAIEEVRAKNILVFPNNKNIILAAEQAKVLSNKNVHIVPTKSIPQGISAMIAFDANATIEENYDNMVQAIAVVKTGNVTYAVRNCTVADKEIKEGDILGIKDGEIFTVGEAVDKVCHQLIEGLIDDESTIVTIFYGNEVNEQSAMELAEYIENHYPDCDVEVHNGGQPLYYYIISVE